MYNSGKCDSRKLENIYEGFLAVSKRFEPNTDLTQQLEAWQQGKWKNYLDHLLRRIPVRIEGKTVVDFGCRYGLLFPLLLELGAKQVIGIEELELYLEPGKQLFSKIGEKVKFLSSEQGYLPLQPESIDLVIMNEVISHINPTILPVVYLEIARILVEGGLLFISDGNNLGFEPYLSEHLVPLYEALENGPDGSQVGDVNVQRCFLNQRKDFIKQRYPELPENQNQFLAENTSGLFGTYLDTVIERFVKTGELIRRPHRKGTPPIYPDWGQVEERGFYPEQVAYELKSYGFVCEILNKPCRPPSEAKTVLLVPSQISPATGYGQPAFQAAFPNEYPKHLPSLMLEDGQPLPYPLDNHAEIAHKGMGRYSIWRDSNTIYFSSSDNSDPRNNGRQYELYWTIHENDQPSYPGPCFQIAATKTNHLNELGSKSPTGFITGFPK